MKGKPNGTMGMRKLVLLDTKMAKGGKVKNDYNIPSTEDLVDMVANAREKQIKKVKQSGVPIVIGRNDGYYFKTSDSPNYSDEILSSRPSKRKVIEIIESNPNITEVYFQGSIRGGDYIGDVDFDIVDDFAVLLWKKPIDVNNAIGTTFQWTETEQDPKNEDKEIPIDPRVYMLVKQSDSHIYKDRPTDDKYFYLNSYFEKNGEQSAIRIPKSDFQSLIEEGALETIEVGQALKEKLLKPMHHYADGGKTRKNAKKTLSEAVGFDINSIDISKL
jgi:biotin operon repressor